VPGLAGICDATPLALPQVREELTLTHLHRDELNHRTVISAAARLDGGPVRIGAGHPCGRHPAKHSVSLVNRGERQVRDHGVGDGPGVRHAGPRAAEAFAHRSVARWHRRPEPVGEIYTRCARRAMHSRSRRRSTDDIAWHHSFFGWSDVLIEGVLRPLRRGGLPLSYTPQPWIERGRPGSIVIPGGTEIILVEGVGAGRDQPWTRASAVVSGQYPVSSDAVRVCLRVSDATEPPGRARL